MLMQLNEKFRRPACWSLSLPRNLYMHLMHAHSHTHRLNKVNALSQLCLTTWCFLSCAWCVCVCVRVVFEVCSMIRWVCKVFYSTLGAYAIMHAFSVFWSHFILSASFPQVFVTIFSLRLKTTLHYIFIEVIINLSRSGLLIYYSKKKKAFNLKGALWIT